MWEQLHPKTAGIMVIICGLVFFAMGFIGLYAFFLRAPYPVPEAQEAYKTGAYCVLILLIPFGGGAGLILQGLFKILGLKIVRIRKPDLNQ